MTERKCVDCSRFDLRGAGDLAKYGYGRCPVRSMNAGHTFSAVKPVLCEKFLPAEPETAVKRIAWLQNQGAV